MNKSIFFRALTLLGLCFVMMACGTADATDGSSGDGTTEGKWAKPGDLTAMQTQIEGMIQNAKGTINTKNGYSVAMKIISIMKAAQPNGSLSPFTIDGLEGSTDGSAAVAVSSATQYIPHKVDGTKLGGAGSYEMKAEKSAGVAAAAGSGGKLVAGAIITHTYKQFSLDGKYFLDGTIVFKQTTVAGAAGDTHALAIEGDKILTLSEGTVAIATIDFSKMKTSELKYADGAKTTDKSYKLEIALMPKDSEITVSPVAPAKFEKVEKVEMKVSAIAETKKNRTQGTNIDLMWALLGPKNFVELDAS